MVDEKKAVFLAIHLCALPYTSVKAFKSPSIPALFAWQAFCQYALQFICIIKEDSNIGRYNPSAIQFEMTTTTRSDKSPSVIRVNILVCVDYVVLQTDEYRNLQV